MAGTGGDAIAEATAVTQTGTASANASADAGNGGAATFGTSGLGGVATAIANATAGGVTVSKMDAASNGDTASASVSLTAGSGGNVTVPSTITGLELDLATGSTISTGSGPLTFQGPEGTGITVVSGNHTIQPSANFAADTTIDVQNASSTLTLSSGFTLGDDTTLTFQGAGTLASASTINNSSTAEFNYSGGELNADVANYGTFNILGGGTRTVYGDFINNGTLKTWDTAFANTGTFTNNGTYISDPADNFFTDLVVGEHGALVGGHDDRFFVGGDLISISSNTSGWDTKEAQLLFEGGNGSHILSVTGDDLGATAAGYDYNFAWRILSLASGESLILQDGNDTEGGSLYVRQLHLADGLDQIASLIGNGLSIYYDPALNAFLSGLSFDLLGGGVLAPVQGAFTTVPEPSSCILLLLSLMAIKQRRLKS